MANKEHLRLLGHGVSVWNAWREENLYVFPDLRGASLAGTRLDHANFSNADLREANFGRANLDSAILIEADLSDAILRETLLRAAVLADADLSDCDLREANFDSANLGHANLRGADLRAAMLSGAILSRADLRAADLRGAILHETTFTDVDLSETKGLDECIHEGPSTIDHRTLQQSGLLPLSFLRGCGLPDKLIEYLPSLLNQTIQFYSCFISYSSKDEEFARRLHADLQGKGIRCWFAPEDMKIGDRIHTKIDEVIRLYEKLLLVLSANSIRSDWVEKEVEAAFEKEREIKSTVLFPLRLDEAVMESRTGWAADVKRTRHIGDFSCWKEHTAYQKALTRLLRDLEAELK